MADKDKLLIRKFMKEISDNISQNELEALKYLCGIESSIAASITKAYQVFDILEKRGEMSINDFRRLKEVLVELHRIDLKKKVEEFEKKVGATRRIPLHSAIKQKFDNDFLMAVSRQVGTNWRMVARRLGVTDTEIDEIDNDYHKLREQSYQAFRIWLDKNGGFEKADPDEIKKALLDFQLKRIAEDFFDVVV